MVGYPAVGLRSINTKIAALVAGALILSTLAVSAMTVWSVERAMRGAAKEAASSALGLVAQNVDGEYANLQAHREYALQSRRDEMLAISRVVTGTLDGLHALETADALTREEAQDTAKQFLIGIRFANDDYFFTYDRNMVAIAHPDPTIMGRNMLDFRDAQGQPIGHIVQEIALGKGYGFVTFWFKRLNIDEPSPKLGFVFHYEPWDWIIGTGVYIGDIEAEADKKLAEIRDQLASSFADITIGQTGFVFVVGGADKDIVVAPTGRDLRGLTNTGAGRQLLADLVRGASESQDYDVARTIAPSGGRSSRWSFRARAFSPLDWYIVSAVPESEIAAPGKRLVLRQTAVNLAVLLVGLALAGVIAGRLVRPLQQLTKLTSELPERDFKLDEAGSEVLAAIARRHSDEVGQLAVAVQSMERALQTYLEELAQATSSRERMESELRIAREIQMGTLPKIFPPFPDRTEFDIHAVLEPARIVGGDLYDFYLSGQETFWFVIGDVSGKGLPASLFMAIAKTLVKAVVERGLEPGEVLAKVNDELAEENPSCLFVSLFVACLDIGTGEVAYACAGHNPPLRLCADGRAEFIPVCGEPVAGPFPDQQFTTLHLSLGSGDALLLYSDGVTEATNEDGGLYSADRLLAHVHGCRAQPSRALIDSILEDVRRFVGEAPQSDDITILALRYLGRETRRPTGEGSCLTVSAQLASLGRCRDFVTQRLESWQVPLARQQRVLLALEEVLANVVRHAYPDAPGDMRVQLWRERTEQGDQLQLEVTDWAAPFDPTSVEPPAPAHDLATQPIGGVGLVLVRELADGIAYARTAGANRLSLRFRLAEGEEDP